ncbi:hypothetical protein [Streptomyces yaizuensis]|uniref:Uncharacterized protein n=1 Tax=Streptomyces yaizuensis TaxID=2989713 RepID=A0AA86IWT5_9ACTN|nr:hypothetical protein [Streptomyces sp. YSPA8]BDT39478.1 hypothetical protein SYYSPA8_36800 [Streptomyces sp. YSPA8]
MVKRQRKKSRDRRRAENTGVARVTAATGTVHQHPMFDLSVLAGLPYAAGRPVNVGLAERMVAACRAGCERCQETVPLQVVADRPTLAALAGAVYGLSLNAGAVQSPRVSGATRSWVPLAQAARESGDGAVALAAVEALSDEDAAALLDDVLDHWAAAGASADEIAALVRAVLPPEEEPAPGTEKSGGRKEAPEGPRVAQGEAYRPVGGGLIAFPVAWGARELLSTGEIAALVRHAEKSGGPGAPDPLICHLCDGPVDIEREVEVHLGLVLLQPQGEEETLMPVWTHERCGHTRVWSWSQLTEERHRRGLPVSPADLPAQRTVPAEPREGDFYVFTEPPGSPPVFYLQPGTPPEHEWSGWRADHLSAGLPPLDLTREQARALPEWTIASNRDRLRWIARRGTGRWYQPPSPWKPGPAWLAAARRHGSAIFLTAPAGSVPTARLAAGTGDLSPLAAVGRAGLLFGARMTITG